MGQEARHASYEQEVRRARASERKDDDGKRKRLPRAVGAGAPLFWTLGAGLSGSAGPCTDSRAYYVASNEVELDWHY